MMVVKLIKTYCMSLRHVWMWNQKAIKYKKTLIHLFTYKNLKFKLTISLDKIIRLFKITTCLYYQ